MCFPLIGVLGADGGSPKGLGHNVRMQFYTAGNSLIEVVETNFFFIPWSPKMTIQGM